MVLFIIEKIPAIIWIHFHIDCVWFNCYNLRDFHALKIRECVPKKLSLMKWIIIFILKQKNSSPLFGPEFLLLNLILILKLKADSSLIDKNVLHIGQMVVNLYALTFLSLDDLDAIGCKIVQN